ncbi:hypothetical protein [Streptomyces subrutilus]|uniref:hypothetical protein n=1 Tax=Streptomyces subrutilus TaxID=36818 RepID=UPI0033F00D7E
MTTTDPVTIPATPVYTITVTGSGVSIDGEPITAPAGDLAAARRAALAEIRVRAALRGRPVRVTAKEPDGSAWPIIVDPDGNVTTLTEPHPAAPAPPPPTPRGTESPTPPTAPPAIHIPPPTALHAPVHDAVPWGSPLPAAHHDTWAQVLAAHGAGDIPAAIILAEKVESALEAEYGPLHPHTVTALSARAWLTLARQSDQYATVELLIHTALRRREAHAQPRTETAQVVRNAHAAWRSLGKEDPEGALELSGALADMLTKFGWQSRTQDVLRWVDKAMSAAQR